MTGFGKSGILPRASLRGGVLGLAAVILVFLAGVGDRAVAQEPARLVLLAPLEDEDVDLPGDFLIAISIIDPNAEIDLSSLRLYVDENNVTSRATVTSAVVTYVPEPPLAPGAHRFDLRLKDAGGRDLPGLRRDVFVEGRIETEPGWGLGGRVVLETRVDDLSGPGAPLRQEPDKTNTARIRLGGHVGGWNYDGTMFLTSDEGGGFQPRNRYRVHLDHGWVGMDAGDVNYTFSPMVLRGKRTRGVGGYLRLGWMEITALQGAIRRGIEGEIQTDPATGDTLAISGATFERGLVGARVALGRGRTFQLGFDGVRVRDDTGSIPAGLLPKDNIVFGSDFVLAPFKRRLILEASAALSFITEDISGGAMSEEEIEDLVEDANVPFDPMDYEDLFIMNLSTRPLDPRDLSSFAFRGGVKWNLLGHIFEGRYQRVGPSFVSLAAPSIQSDKRGFRATDTFRLFGKRLRVSGELERFEDNLNDDKEFTTDTRIVGVTTSFVPRRAPLQHLTLSYRLYDRENDARGESGARVDDRTATLWTRTGYHFRLYQGHELSASYMRSKTDAFSPFADATQTDWILGWTTLFDALPLMLELAYGVNDTEYPFTGAHVKYSTRRLRGTYDFLGGRLETHASIIHVNGDSNQSVLGGDKLTLDTGARYRLATRTFLSGRLSLVDFADAVDSGNDYEETVFSLRLAQDF